MSIATRIKSLLGIEGSWRGPFSGMGELGGVYGISPLGDGWQRNLTVDAYNARHVPAVYACVMAISRSIAQCYPKHIRASNDQFVEVTNSAAYRVLNHPNAYQTSPDLLLNMVATALFEGEAFVLATRNNRQEIESLHLLPRGVCSPMVDPETREIFYSVGSSPLAPGGIDFIVPNRDVLHLRFHTPRHPLIGETPIKSSAMAIGINVALSHSQAAFFNNMNRPSGILSTEANLTRDQMAALRAAFEDQAKGMAQGRIPILGSGIKFSPMSISSQDSQLIQAQRMSIEDICRVFGVPPPLVGDLTHATLNNSETLIQHFLAMSLGSYLEHIERAFDRLFGITGVDYIEFDLSALLRTDFAGRVDALTKGVSGGLFTPNEARKREGLGPVEGGDTTYLQAQMTPVNKLEDLIESQIEENLAQVSSMEAAAAAPEANPAEAPSNDTPDAAENSQDQEKNFDADVVKALLFQRLANKKAA